MGDQQQTERTERLLLETNINRTVWTLSIILIMLSLVVAVALLMFFMGLVTGSATFLMFNFSLFFVFSIIGLTIFRLRFALKKKLRGMSASTFEG